MMSDAIHYHEPPTVNKSGPIVLQDGHHSAVDNLRIQLN